MTQKAAVEKQQLARMAQEQRTRADRLAELLAIANKSTNALHGDFEGPAARRFYRAQLDHHRSSTRIHHDIVALAEWLHRVSGATGPLLPRPKSLPPAPLVEWKPAPAVRPAPVPPPTVVVDPPTASVDTPSEPVEPPVVDVDPPPHPPMMEPPQDPPPATEDPPRDYEELPVIVARPATWTWR